MATPPTSGKAHVGVELVCASSTAEYFLAVGAPVAHGFGGGVGYGAGVGGAGVGYGAGGTGVGYGAGGTGVGYGAG